MCWYVKWQSSNGIVPAVRCDDTSKLREIFDQVNSAQRRAWIEDDLGNSVSRDNFAEADA
jgi:hypothetical protein